MRLAFFNFHYLTLKGMIGSCLDYSSSARYPLMTAQAEAKNATRCNYGSS